VGIELPKIEVRFEHLNVAANVSIGERGLPSLPNFVLGALEVKSLLGGCKIRWFFLQVNVS
jgi:hypothetical protein